MSAAALAVAVADGLTVVEESCAGAAAVPVACAATARLWVSRVSSAVAVALPVAARPLCAVALPEDDARPVEVAGIDNGTPAAAPAIEPDSAPASAFSSSVRAADTGSVAECFAVGSPVPSVLAGALPFAAAASVAAALAAGAAASDSASVAEKSSLLVASSAAEFAEASRDAVEDRAVGRPERELPVCVLDFAVCDLPDGLERRELAVPEWLAEDPSCEEDAGFEAEEGALAEPLSPPPGLDAAGARELAALGAAAGAGAGNVDLGDTCTGMEDKVSTESVAMGDRPA